MKEETYKELLRYSFSIDLNANDYFYYACAMSVTVNMEDIEGWILPFLDKYPKRGMDVCMAYIQNQEPIKPWVSDEFKSTMGELLKISPEVHSDCDYGNDYNYEEIVYRKVNYYESKSKEGI